MRRLPVYLIFLLLSSIIILSWIVSRSEIKRQACKNDLIELNNIRYGLFSVDEWKNMAASIIANKIHEMEFSDENKEVMREKISAFLYELIDGFEERFYEDKSTSLSGIIQSGIVSLTGTFSQLRQDVPVFTEQIIAFLDEPESRETLRAYLSGQLEEFSLQTYSATDYSKINQIVEKYGYNNRYEAMTGLIAELQQAEDRNRISMYILVGLVLTAGVTLVFLKNISNTEWLIFIVLCITLLIPGVLLPMIEIDARITDLSFTLLGENVVFKDQVLFYQSKSILEIVGIMFGQRAIDLIIVGILILAFSVLFPAAKLTATAFYIYSERLRNLGFIRTLVFRTGKWSMADVMVVAIFMAYIGFNGIITDQLHQIEDLAGTVEVITTNNSGILAGFWFFTAFVLMGLLISQKLHQRRNH